jgi:hypothetical protein
MVYVGKEFSGASAEVDLFGSVDVSGWASEEMVGE